MIDSLQSKTLSQPPFQAQQTSPICLGNFTDIDTTNKHAMGETSYLTFASKDMLVVYSFVFVDTLPKSHIAPENWWFGWSTILSFWEPLFPGAMLVFGSVSMFNFRLPVGSGLSPAGFKGPRPIALWSPRAWRVVKQWLLPRICWEAHGQTTWKFVRSWAEMPPFFKQAKKRGVVDKLTPFFFLGGGVVLT